MTPTLNADKFPTRHLAITFPFHRNNLAITPANTAERYTKLRRPRPPVYSEQELLF
jgi:hypothetical protein